MTPREYRQIEAYIQGNQQFVGYSCRLYTDAEKLLEFLKTFIEEKEDG